VADPGSSIDALVQQLREAATIGLHLGCGRRRIEGLINADAFDASVRDVEMDALDLSRYPDATVDLVESHHMFEHLSFAEGHLALREWHRAVRPGGHLVMSLPNLDEVIRLWVGSDESERFAPQSGTAVIAMLYGSQQHPGMFHRSGYNPPRLRELLSGVGFEVVKLHEAHPQRLTPSMTVVARRL
jgi:predicted SAM-dependent methyltransferase